MTALYTPWGEQLDRTCPLPEYPRPQLRRDSYLCGTDPTDVSDS